jgi:hypothetical protein
MIVIGVDVHKQSLTPVAVDEGRVLEERTLGVCRVVVGCRVHPPARAYLERKQSGWRSVSSAVFSSR